MLDGNEKNENDNEKESGNEKEKENIDDIGKGKREGRYEPKDDGVDVQDDVNNEHGFEKEKQAEADKVENNRENIYLEHDHFTQDQFWDKEFTDEDYEQLITQVVEDHKKKTSMTRSKRKTIKDMTPPSSSLGLSPLESVLEYELTSKNKEEKMLDMFKWKKKDGKDDEDK
ncbi:hypothetical protein Tco_1398123 [Tanacetum coccineum]